MKMARGLRLFANGLKTGLVGCVVIGALAACSSEDTLRSFRDTSPGPEEFNVVPTKPLQTPENLASLPVPTPGGSNRVDPTPKADAVAALGGNAAALNSTAVPSSDGALLSYAGRAGVDPSIRASLAAEDAEFRRKEARWTSLNPFNIDRYYRAYEDQTLQPRDVAEAYRRAGYDTPSYPPQ
ncbi:DUF3035 domain-containing protein [Pseudooceanicola algae]|uniref:Beta-barrel assembly machine subunit BamF n=1 Tax=Pseudooceanicola algae TaxID=1537215 RepID=A0A418SG46_9RHOB|nr:DUF3035 domain-containing protein [Pseudooceanicola algae]QPM91647.1 hypothetical protein PSAL_029020 [Pseudooceanicola algae]